MEVLVCKTTDGGVYKVSNINYETSQLTYVEKYHNDGKPYVHNTVPLTKIEKIFWLDERGIKNG